MRTLLDRLVYPFPGFLLATSLMLGAIPPVQAQSATERYIPIGQSPGLSQRYTYTGKIKKQDQKARAVVVSDGGERRAVSVTPATKIWLDRSKRGRETRDGSFEDCRKGRRVEIKYADANRQVAEWIKVESR